MKESLYGVPKAKQCIVCSKDLTMVQGNVKTCSKECSVANRKFLRSPEYKNLHTNFENRDAHAKVYYQNNIDRLKENSINRYNNLTEEELKKKREIDSKYQRDAIKVKAKQAVKRAIKRGDIIKQNCHVCNNEHTEAHHPDYTKPLYVVWLCKKHHEQVHQKYNPLILENI